MRAAIASGEMPPWPPNDCCQSYRHNRSLSAAARDTLLRWLDAGAPEGDPTGAPPSQPPPPPRLSRVDLTLRMPMPYTPVATEETSELRCFLIEGWPFAEEKYITGIDVRPGNRSIVHHVIVQTVGLGELPEIRSREGRDGRPGFDCRNVRGEIHANGGVGGWMPGTPPRESPDGTIGLRFPANSQVLLQVHYDIRNGVSMPDQIEIDFQIADQVKHRGKGLVVMNPLWLAGDALEIEAGEPDAMHNFAYDPTVLLHARRSALHPRRRAAHALRRIARPGRDPAGRRIVGLPARHSGLGLPLGQFVRARRAGPAAARRHALRRVPLGQLDGEPAAGRTACGRHRAT